MCEAIGNGKGMRRALRRVALEHHDGDVAIALLWLQQDPRDPAKLAVSAVAHFSALRDLGERIAAAAVECAESADPSPSPQGVAMGAESLAALAVACLRVARDLSRLAKVAEK